MRAGERDRAMSPSSNKNIVYKVVIIIMINVFKTFSTATTMSERIAAGKLPEKLNESMERLGDCGRPELEATLTFSKPTQKYSNKKNTAEATTAKRRSRNDFV